MKTLLSFCVYMCEVCTCVRCGMQKHGTGGQRAAPHLPRFWALNSGPPACVMNTFSFIYVCVYKHICPCLYGCTHLRVEVRSQLRVSCPLRQALSLNLGSIGFVRCQDTPACLCPSELWLQACREPHLVKWVLAAALWSLFAP